MYTYLRRWVSRPPSCKVSPLRGVSHRPANVVVHYVFTLVDRGSDQRYVVPAKSADESTVRLLFDNRVEESLTVYTDGFRVYDPLEDDEDFQREAMIHSDGEYADGDAHVSTCESHTSLARRWLSPHRGVSKDKLTPYFRAFQLRQRILRKPGQEALKEVVRTVV